MEQYEQELLQYLRDNNFYYEVDIYDDKIYVEITWGDWKHDHGWCDYLIEDFFNKKPEIYKVIGTVNVTEENGSDCYSATHIYKIIKK